jgi:Tol biopolymer transport system component
VTVPFPSSAIRGWSLSRDARRLGLVFGDGHRTDLWLSDLLQGGMHRFTNDGQNVAPLWSLDGRRIIYASRRDGPFNLFVRTLDEAAMSSSRIQDSPRQQLPTDISADGIVYVDAHPRTGLDLWLLPWSGTASPSSAIAPSSSSSSTSAQSTSASSTPASSASAAPVPLVQTPFDETNGTISPDGRWLAWQSNESGHWEVTLRTRSAANAAPAGGAGDVRVGPSDGARIAWTPDSRALLFTHAGRLMMAPLASPDDTPATATAAADTRAPHIVATGVDARSEFAVAADGRVLVRTRDTEADAAATRIEVVLDWSRELSAKVPIRPRTPRPVR